MKIKHINDEEYVYDSVNIYFDNMPNEYEVLCIYGNITNWLIYEIAWGTEHLVPSIRMEFNLDD